MLVATGSSRPLDLLMLVLASGSTSGRRLIVPRPAVEFHGEAWRVLLPVTGKRSFDSSERQARCLP